MYAIEKLDPDYDDGLMALVLGDAAWIVRGHRPWFRRQYDTFGLHPVVKAAIELTRPLDWHQLLLEWPHRSTTDPNMVAFTRDERSGEADRVVTTSMGKYLGRHFKLPDHYVRDLVALHTMGEDTLKLVHTSDEMIHHIQNGPHSCMRWPDLAPEEHPYRVYDPKYGWHMAVRIEPDGMTCGRALCCTLPDGRKIFVRSYNRDRSGGYSHADNKLEAWLKAQGYEHSHSWDGCIMAHIHSRNGAFLAPYLDGSAQWVYVRCGTDNTLSLRITDDESEAEYTCSRTDGIPEEQDPSAPCEDCDDPVTDGDQYWVGRDDARMVCWHCRDQNYTQARSRSGRWRWIPADETVYVDTRGEHYDADYLSDNDIVELENGDYADVDDAVYVDDAWYHCNDERIVCCADDKYRLIEECVEIDNKWYDKDDDDIVEVDGDWYLKSDDDIVECDDGEYRLKDDCFQCPACDAWHAREAIEA